MNEASFYESDFIAPFAPNVKGLLDLTCRPDLSLVYGLRAPPVARLDIPAID